MHTLTPGKVIETWKTMVELKKEGLLKSSGVSNFNIQHIQPIITCGFIYLCINFILP